MNPPLRQGEIVRLRWGSRAAVGHVTLASENGKSIMVSGEFVLAGFVAHAPLIESNDQPTLETVGRFETLNGVPVIVERGPLEDPNGSRD
jgi:hypothetical protein